jgi:guanylate kinase
MKADGPETGAFPAPRATAHIFILSAPSGAGKTTLRRALLSAVPEILFSVSYTTRRRREGERDGQDYVFVSAEEFRQGIAAGRWAEWAEVHGHYYGTSAEVLRQALADGTDVLLEIDVQGARQILARFPDSVTIFILPPSLETLRQRLAARGTESAESLALRMENARREMAQKDFYRHRIVNDDLASASRQLVAVVESYRGRAA